MQPSNASAWQCRERDDLHRLGLKLKFAHSRCSMNSRPTLCGFIRGSSTTGRTSPVARRADKKRRMFAGRIGAVKDERRHFNENLAVQ
jgi:hypothetical protein